MNKNVKRLLSLVLCLMMVLAVLPLAAMAADTDTIRVYCQAPDGWTKCNAYWWGSTGENPGWPGKAMVTDRYGIWYIDIPADAPNIIFNDGTKQSPDLKVPTDDKVMYIYNTKTWDVYGKQDVTEPEEADFYVAGASALCGSNWDPSDTANGLFDKDGDGIYTKTYENVAAGSYELKVTDGTWTNSWGKEGGNDNYVLTVTEDGSTVEIRFDSTTHLITAVIGGDVITETTAAPVPEGFYVAGTFNGWNAGDINYMMTAGADGIYTLDVAVTTDDNALKVTDGTWTNAWGGTGEGGNYEFKVVENGTITVTFDSVNYVVTVTGDCLEEIVKEPLVIDTVHAVGDTALTGAEWDTAANQMTGENGVYTITFTGIAAGTYNFKFAANGTWDINWASGVEMTSGEIYDAWISPLGNSSVVVPGNDATVTLTLDLSAMDPITGNGGKCSVTVDCVVDPTDPTDPSEPSDPSDPSEPSEPAGYALVGYINGADYGCNEDYENVGEYIFVDGTLSTSFNTDSYIFIKTTDNANWFLSEAYTEETTATFVSGAAEKMKVPGGVELTFTLVDNGDGTLTLSYVTGDPVETEATEATDPSEPVEAAYYVAGSFNNWNEKDETYRMSDNGDGTWSLIISAMAEGSYEMKVTDGTWTNSWGSDAGNFTFKVVSACDVTVTFNSETHEITVTGDGVNTEKEPLAINTVHAAGAEGLTGFNWNPAENQMTGENGVYTITFTDIAAGEYEFKFAANGDWAINWASGIEMPSGEIQDAWINPLGNSKITVAENGSSVTLTLDLTTMDPITGEGGKCSATIEAPGIDPNFTGLKETAEGTFYYVNGVQSTATGLTKIDGVWYYLKSGRWASELNQLAKYNNEWWYLVDGKVASTTTALIDLNGEDWYVVKGKIAANTTGLIKVDGIWYYVVKGKVAGNTTNLVKYNGEWFYVVKGKVASNITSMVKYNGEWFYMVKGKLAAKTTTLVKHEGKWCYVYNGKLAGKTTTLVKYNGEWFYVINGYVDSTTTGIVQYSGGWYYLVKGKIAAKTTTLVKYGGAWYYVSGGSVNWKYTGTFVYGGKTYNIKNGKVV